ncbi:expressed unknown protein [Seminavis robusta]|uniref:Uncharacterized protein n=1 Tax=Seminavis robusta TaxID=568900 RepID=A0A9N8EQ51_9STRA|nr:expressed unknown protein [Seminavis robusta]|eukprot:Sro1754_g295470.1 n/a (277) ;mRNA; r:18058-18888
MDDEWESLVDDQDPKEPDDDEEPSEPVAPAPSARITAQMTPANAAFLSILQQVLVVAQASVKKSEVLVERTQRNGQKARDDLKDAFERYLQAIDETTTKELEMVKAHRDLARDLLTLLAKAVTTAKELEIKEGRPTAQDWYYRQLEESQVELVTSEATIADAKASSKERLHGLFVAYNDLVEAVKVANKDNTTLVMKYTALVNHISALLEKATDGKLLIDEDRVARELEETKMAADKAATLLEATEKSNQERLDGLLTAFNDLVDSVKATNKDELK